MGEPATPIRRRLELSVAEARLRFQQLVRVTGVTGQITVVVDGGRPIAAIVPPSDVLGTGPAPPAPRPEPPARRVQPSARRSEPPAPRSTRPAAMGESAASTDSFGAILVTPAGSSTPTGFTASAGSGSASAGVTGSAGSGPGAAGLTGSAGSPPASAVPSGSAGEQAAAGWLRRIEKVREDVRRQHAGRTRELSQALDEAWRLLDDLRPPGTDRAADTLRAAHSDLRRAR